MMNLEFLSPVEDSIAALSVILQPETIGQNLLIHQKSTGFPNLEGVNLAIIGVDEDRQSEDNLGSGKGLPHIREKLYQLFKGNWQTKIADLGTIKKGSSVKDTHFAVSEVIAELLKSQIIPIVIGGGQDLTFANYKAYDSLEQVVNLVTVDSMFDLGNVEDELSSRSYLSKIIMQKPTNLFNYCNIGYQTYLNSQQEINLIHELDFDAYRLGEAKNMELVETVLRDADMVSIDVSSIRQSDAPANRNVSPNGFYGEEICAISRYAGISDKVSSFGIYEYNHRLDNPNNQTAHLIAQMIWHFIEGVNQRAKDYPFCTKENYQKFTVVLEDDEPINFYKSDRSGRWWMEINIIGNNKYKRHTLIPCTYQDYIDATKEIIPKKWYKAMSKMAEF